MQAVTPKLLPTTTIANIYVKCSVGMNLCYLEAVLQRLVNMPLSAFVTMAHLTCA